MAIGNNNEIDKRLWDAADQEVHVITVIVPSPSVVKKNTKPLFRKNEILTNKNNNFRKTCYLLLPKLIRGEIDVEGLDI